MSVVHWPGHKLHGAWSHADDEFSRLQLAEGRCFICEGGLACCTTCDGAEASLPTQCPGTQMSEHLRGQVQAGRMDYTRQLGWHVLTVTGRRLV